MTEPDETPAQDDTGCACPTFYAHKVDVDAIMSAYDPPPTNERERALIERTEEFTKVLAIRRYLDLEAVTVPRVEDLRMLVEQAEFWKREFTDSSHRAAALISQLRADLASAGGADPLEPVVKACEDVSCPEEVEIRVDFESSTWEVVFDLAGSLSWVDYGPGLRGEVPELAEGDGPRVTGPDIDRGEYWFRVAVRATDSRTAVELAREVLRERCGVTGDGLAVMEGEATAAEAGTTPEGLGWLRRWAAAELARAEASADEFRTRIARLDAEGVTL